MVEANTVNILYICFRRFLKNEQHKVFGEQRLVKKTAKVIFLFSSHDGVFFGKEHAL